MAGRKSSLDEVITIDDKQMKRQDAIIMYAKRGSKPGVIAGLVGVHPDTIRNWISWGNPKWEPREGTHEEAEAPKDRTPYFLFFQRYQAARAIPAANIEAAWEKVARDGNWNAAQAWLKAHRKDDYEADEVNVNVSGSVNVAHDIAETLRKYGDAFADDTSTDTDQA